MHQRTLSRPGLPVACALLLALLLGCRADTEANQAMPKSDSTAPVALRAGPIRLTLQDGELRYLRVGDTEVFRRVYFAVRDGKWNTIMPHFTETKVEQHDDGFTVRLSARCRREPVDYSWSGRIEGARDGKITFHAEGVAGADFQSNRIGLCVLYGSSLVGEKFQTSESPDGTGTPTDGEFPPLVSPSSHLVGKHFRLLRYTREGLRVSGGVEGAFFDMEDQRNWGDSSFKAYAPLPYQYPNVTKGDRKEQTVTLTVSGSSDETYAEAGAVHIRIGGPVEGAKLPRLVEHDSSSEKPTTFVDINNNRGKYADAKSITWPYTSATHLPDDDTLMENPPALLDQTKTIRSFAPQAALRVGPIRLEAGADAAPDPRRGKPIAEAWVAEVIRAMALGGVEEAEFDVGPVRPDWVISRLRREAGAQVLSADAAPAAGTVGPAFAVQALAFQTKDGPHVWLLNRTPRNVSAVLDGLGKPYWAWRLGNSPVDPPQPDPKETSTRVDLGPYEVVRVEPAPAP